MNFWYTGFLIVWCVLIIGNCYQGQNLITPNNIESNIYIYFQLLSTATSVMIAIVIASSLCIKYCYKNDWESDDVLAFVILPLTIVQITMFALIGDNIGAVSGESDTKNFKIVLTVCGGFSAIPVFYSLYKIIKFLFPTPEEQAERENREKIIRSQQLQAHKSQEYEDVRKANEVNKIILENEKVQSIRQSDLLRQNAEKEIYEKNKTLERQRAEDDAERILSRQRLDTDRFQKQREANKKARVSSDEIENYRLEEELRIKQLEKETEKEDLEYKIKMKQLQDKKARDDERQTRKLNEMQEMLKYKDSNKNEEIADLEQQLSLKEIERMKEDQEFQLGQLKRQLDLARLGKGTRQEIAELQKQILDTTLQIKELTVEQSEIPSHIKEPPRPPRPTFVRLPEPNVKPEPKEQQSDTFTRKVDVDPIFESKNQESELSSTIAQFNTDDEQERKENEQQCTVMTESLGKMKECTLQGSQLRNYYITDKVYEKLQPSCPDNYEKIDRYQKSCMDEADADLKERKAQRTAEVIKGQVDMRGAVPYRNGTTLCRTMKDSSYKDCTPDGQKARDFFNRDIIRDAAQEYCELQYQILNEKNEECNHSAGLIT